MQIHLGSSLHAVVVLKALNVLELLLDLGLEALVLTLEVIALVHHIGKLLIPLGPVLLMTEQEFGLLGLRLGLHLLKFPLFDLELFALFIHLLLVFLDFEITLSLNIFDLLLHPRKLALQLLVLLAHLRLLCSLIAR